MRSKVLWLYNAVTADFSEIFDLKKTYSCGWTRGLFDVMKDSTEYEIIPCFPIKDKQRVSNGEIDGVKYYSIHVGHGELNDDEIINNTVFLINDVKPRIVHIWGTEYYFSSGLFKACEKLGIESVLIDMQGNINAIANSLSKGLPYEVYIKKTEDMESILEQAERLRSYSIGEKYILENGHFFCGRTLWDKLYLKQFNAKSVYFHCDRVFRSDFYNVKQRWSVDGCTRHSIFVSQASYSLKGFHYLVNALSIIGEKYNDVHVFVGGNNTFLSSEGKTSYGEYIIQLMQKTKVDKFITFLGVLDEKEMIDKMLSSNVMVSTSIIENNANSVCEAMYLGLPIVASFVGGVSSVVQDGVTGLMYSYDDERMLAGLICMIFDNDELAKELSDNARSIAARRHNRDNIMNKMNDVYKSIEVKLKESDLVHIGEK